MDLPSSSAWRHRPRGLTTKIPPQAPRAIRYCERGMKTAIFAWVSSQKLMNKYGRAEIRLNLTGWPPTQDQSR